MNMIHMASLLAQSAAGDSEVWMLMKLWGKTICWAIAGGIGMGLGLVVSLKVFTLLTRDVDEWGEVKKNNLGMSIILASVILGTSLVIMMSVR
jgi:uncharacterized membrane protein YjfL (UPF0719 family)